MADKIGLLLIFVDIIFIGSIVVAFLIGMIKGIRKSCRTLLGFIPALIILFLLLTPICKGIINFDFVPIVSKVNQILQLDFLSNLPEKGSVKELILFALNQTGIFNTQVTDASSIYLLIEGFIFSIIKIFVYMLGLSVCTFIIMPIVRILIRLIGGKIDKKPKIYSRIIGGFIFTAFYLVFCFVWIFPLTGTLNVVARYAGVIHEITENSSTSIKKTNVEENQDYIIDINEHLDQEIIQKVDKISGYAKLYEDRISLKILTINFKADSFALGNMTKLKTKNGSINTLKILNETSVVLQKFAETSIQEGKIKNWEDIIDLSKGITKVFIESKTIEVIVPVLIETLETSKFNEDIKIDLTEIKMINWEEEAHALGNIINVCLDFAKDVNLNPDDPLAILSNPNLDALMAELGKSLQESKTITKVLLGLLNEPLQEMLLSELGDNEDVRAILEILDLNNIAENGNWGNDFGNLSNIVRALYEIGLFSESGELDYSNTEAIKRLLTKPFELSIIKGNEETIIKAMISLVEASDILVEYGVTEEKLELILRDIVWSEEVGSLADAVIYALQEINKYESDEFIDKIKQMLLNVSEEELDKILTALFDSKLLIRMLPLILENILTEQNLQDLISDYVKNASLDPSTITSLDYTEEKELIIEAVLMLQNIDFGDEGFSVDYLMEHAQDELIDIISSVISSKFINQEGVVRMIEDLINEELGYTEENQIHFEDEVIPQTKEAWDNEFKTIKNLLQELEGFDFGSIDVKNEEHIDKIQNIITILYSSPMIASVTNAILESEVIDTLEDMINEELGYIGNDRIEIDSNNIPKNAVEWNNELDLLQPVLLNLESITDYDLTNTETINKIKSIISNLYDSKLFGTLVNKILKDEVIIEVEAAINDNLDLSVPIVIKDENIPINKTEWLNEIDLLSQILKDFDSITDYDFTDPETINTIKSIITSLYDSKLIGSEVNQILEEVVVDEVESAVNTNLGLTTPIIITNTPENKTEWLNEIDLLSNLLTEYDTITTYDFTSEATVISVKLIISSLYDSILIGDSVDQILDEVVVDEIENAINTNLGLSPAVEVTSVPSGKEEWNNEIDALHNLIVNADIINSSEFNFDETTDREVLADTLTLITQSKMLNPHIETIVESFIPSLGMNNIDFDGLDFVQAKTWNFNEEVESIYNIKNDLQEFQDGAVVLSDLSNIGEILHNANTSNIASYILGKEINKQLINEYTSNEDEVAIINKYDFSQKSVMQAQETPLNAMINFGVTLGKVKSEMDALNLTDETVQEFTTNFAALEAEDGTHYTLVDDLLLLVIKKELGSEVTLTEAEISGLNYHDESAMFEDALNKYNSGDPIGAVTAVASSILAKELLAALLA